MGGGGEKGENCIKNGTKDLKDASSCGINSMFGGGKNALGVQY